MSTKKKHDGLPTPLNTVSIQTAVDATTNWRHYNESLPGTGDYVRAFFIPMQDLDGLNDVIQNNPGAIGVRVYLGKEDTLTDQSAVSANGLKLYIVAVEGTGVTPDNGMDILMTPDTGASEIYDFTMPCPSTCDFNSLLYTGTDSDDE